MIAPPSSPILRRSYTGRARNETRSPKRAWALSRAHGAADGAGRLLTDEAELQSAIGHRAIGTGYVRAPSIMLFGDAVGMTLESRNPAVANKSPNSAWVRMRPPGWL